MRCERGAARGELGAGRGERGTATVEWVGLVLLVTVALGGLASVAPAADGRTLGGLIAHHLVCAARGGCDDGDRELRATYGADDAALLRRHAPSIVYEPGTLTLPVDFRECRDHRCSDAPDDPDLDVHASARGRIRATAFTRVVRSGDETFLQYWLYYPDSTTTALNAAGGWRAASGAASRLGAERRRYPGYHPDDWESYQVRIDARGAARARSSSHHGYQGCKQWRCKDRWGRSTGWTRVSWGSHAGHVPLRRERVGPRFSPRTPLTLPRYRDRPLYPGRDMRERSTTSPGLRLVPLESIDQRSYRPLAPGIMPPWRKRVYNDPLSDSTS